MSMLMQCGYVANAVNQKGEPSCVICIGLHDGAEQRAEQPNLTIRLAFCVYRSAGPYYHGSEKGQHGQVSSSLELAFFVYQPKEQGDQYYCGCFGWD